MASTVSYRYLLITPFTTEISIDIFETIETTISRAIQIYSKTKRSANTAGSLPEQHHQILSE